MPEVSVIIPTYNYACFLGTAIQSVLTQTWQDLELIIVDDGSTDNTREVVESFQSDHRVRYVFQSNRGDSAARNTGISHSTGRYLGFLDADDYWMPEKLELQLALLRSNPQAAAVHSSAYVDTIDQQQRLISRFLLQRPPLREKTLYEELLYNVVIVGSHSSIVLSRDVLDKVGGFDESLMCCDWDLWRRISNEHEILYIDSPLTGLRRHGANQTANPDVVADNSERILKKFVGEIPLLFRHHRYRMRTERYLKLAWLYFRARRWGATFKYAAKAIFNALRCPGFTIQFLSGKLRNRLSGRAPVGLQPIGMGALGMALGAAAHSGLPPESISRTGHSAGVMPSDLAVPRTRCTDAR